MEIRLLGAVEIAVDGRVLDSGPPRQRLVLAILAAEAGRPVSVESLIDRTWDEPPEHPRRTLQVYLSRVRRLLDDAAAVGQPPVRISRRSGGYLLDIDPDGVDIHRFRSLIGQARHEDRLPPERARLLGEALDLWRGLPLADLPGGWATRVRQGLQQQYLETVALWAEESVRAGDPGAVLARLGELVGEHPLAESLATAYMRALYAAGRPADALHHYTAIRHRLADELGTDPGPELQQLHRQILTADPALSPPEPAAATTKLVPRQLPAPPPGFTGRAAELATLDQAPDASTMVITAIDGMAGVGKTALAVQAAHRLAGRYPDGQLFIDLYGYTHGVEPIQPAEALDHLLRALGMSGGQIPNSLDERAALYRTRLADQRMLIVLDNAAAEAQVAPLLPGAPGCLVLVTSRRRLAGLDHTHTLSLDTLPTPDAVGLFRQTAGEGRVAGQPLEQLVELCGRLPLAIRIAAARLRSHPSWRLSNLVERLRDQRHRLGELAAGQRSVVAALDLSYEHLNADQQQAYGLLGLHPGGEFDAYAAAALFGSTLPHATRMLDHLLEAHLLQEPMPGRYRFHDLIRAHAAATADPTQGAVLERLLDYYRHTASVAMDAAYPYERGDRPQFPFAHTPVPDLPDDTAALSWLDTELPNLLAAARYAADHGRPAHLLHLSNFLHWHLRIRGRYHDAVTLHQQALATAHASGDQAGQLDALIGLGTSHFAQGRHSRAAEHHQQALQLARGTGDRPNETNALLGLGHIHVRQGRHTQAADCYRRALQLARTTGHRPNETTALRGLGEIHRIQGRYPQATDHYQQALRLARAAGYHLGVLDALNGLGHIHLRQGRYSQAADHYQEALQLARTTSDHMGELHALNGLGHIHLQQGHYPQAADHYRQALRLARTTGNQMGELNALNGLGHIHLRQGRYQQATDHYEQLLAIAEETGVRDGQFEARQGLGRLLLATDRPDEALAYHDQALALARELSQPHDQARAHDGLAHAYHALNQPQQARTHWQHALDILTGLGIDHTEDEEATTTAIRVHLAALAQRDPTA
jgi:tetratricopeptide (TPR) repeat protein/DNA-binding SARP family transcriptional activator